MRSGSRYFAISRTRRRTSRATWSRSRRRSSGSSRRLQPLELGDARPLAVDREEAPAGEPERVLDDAAAEGRVRLEEVGRQLGEGAREDVLPRRSTAAGAGHDQLEPAQAVRRPVELRAAGLLEGLHLGEGPLRLREPTLQVLGRPGEAHERVLAAPLHLEPELLLGAGHVVERLLQAIDGGIGGRARGPKRRGERVADEDGEQEPGEGEDGGEGVHRRPA